MQSKLKKSFPQIEQNSCIETLTNREFEIYDCEEEKRCYITTEYGQFKVINSLEKEITFLAIDKCLFFDSDRFKKCDCLIFDDNTICFVEIKACKFKQRKSNKKTAIGQLKSTIEIFRKEFNIDKKIEAYLCIGMNPKNPPRTSTSDKILEFEEELDTKLFDGCQKEFK
jgi:hypothetical protein